MGDRQAEWVERYLLLYESPPSVRARIPELFPAHSAPVQLNSSPSPPPDPNQEAEDDVSWVAVTSQYVYGAWGDWRPTANNPVAAGSSPPSGEINSWIARVPITSF